ncbi:MAG: DUF1573 domain-containing protein [Tannerellaceae bacterium]|nr:DUF1573 domain-containing protein [Tannerellaceae bacterium]
MRQVIFVFMAILMAAGMVSAQEVAVMAIEETSYDFGEIKEAGEKVSHTFKVVNKGDAPLVITRVIPSCGCTTPEWTKEPIAPGASGEVTVTFDPKGRPLGPFVKNVSIYSNGKKGSFILTIRGDVK